MADAAGAAAVRASLGFGACLGAGAGAIFAGDRGRDAHLRGLAGKSLFEADLHVVAQIGPALARRAAAAATASAAHAEEIVENVGEGGGEIGTEAGTGAAALLERGVAVAVVGGALVRIFEDLVSLVDLLKAVLAILVAGIAVRMPFHGRLAESGFQVAVDGRAFDLEDFVVAALGHPRVPPLRCAVIAEFDLFFHGTRQKLTGTWSYPSSSWLARKTGRFQVKDVHARTSCTR